MICVFDCETIPDIELIRKTYDVSGDDKEATLQALAKHQELTNSTFLPLPFHKVVAISAVFADEDRRFIEVKTSSGKDEKEKIERFFAIIDNKNPKLVSFNGRAFDLPMLLLRAMKYNLSCPAYFNDEKNRWENYRSRYSERFHLDLLDVLGNFGAARALKLDTICQMVGLPGKFDVSGEDVLELYYENRLDKIESYCESDVLNTYLLFLKYELLKGHITLDGYKDIVASMKEKLEDQKYEAKDYRDIFINFLQKESDGSH